MLYFRHGEAGVAVPNTGAARVILRDAIRYDPFIEMRKLRIDNLPLRLGGKGTVPRVLDVQGRGILRLLGYDRLLHPARTAA